MIENCRAAGVHLNFDTLKLIVDTNNKQRFAFSESFSKIRANQGHSIEVQLDYEAKEPPEILYHGTGLQSVSSILQSGIEKRNRHHVHLSTDIETARNVGRRHVKPAIFKVFAGTMFSSNIIFYLSDNGVWLTDYVAPGYLEIV